MVRLALLSTTIFMFSVHLHIEDKAIKLTKYFGFLIENKQNKYLFEFQTKTIFAITIFWK